MTQNQSIKTVFHYMPIRKLLESLNKTILSENNYDVLPKLIFVGSSSGSQSCIVTGVRSVYTSL